MPDGILTPSVRAAGMAACQAANASLGEAEVLGRLRGRDLEQTI
jgi:hypothetical protein